MNKKVSTAIGLIIVVAAAISVVGVLAWQQGWLEQFVGISTAPSTSTPTPTPTPDETADWKIYRNEKYGFEIKIPSGASYEEDKSDLDNSDTIFITNNNESFSIKISPDLTAWHPNAAGIIPLQSFSEGDIFYSEDVVINDIPFGKNYYFTYGGAGSTDEGYILYTKNQHGGFYLIVEDESLSLTEIPRPDEVVDHDACNLGYWEKCFFGEKEKKWTINEIKTGRVSDSIKFINEIMATFRFVE